MVFDFLLGWLLVATGIGLLTLVQIARDGLHQPWSDSFCASALSALPGTALVVEFGVRFGLSQLGTTTLPAYDWPTSVLVFFWILIGPFFLVAAIARRPLSSPPWQVSVLQVGHFASWASSSLVGFTIAASV